MMYRRYSAFLLLCVLAAPAFGQTAYYDDLLATLRHGSGLEGGTWLLPPDEQQALDHGQLTNVEVTTQSVTGQRFTRSRTYTSQQQNKPWEAAIRFPITASVQANDVGLLVLWLRTTHGDAGNIDLLIERDGDPYTKSFNFAAGPSGEWRQWLVPFEFAEDYTARGARVQINMGREAQSLEIGGVALLNYRRAYSVDDLPSQRFVAPYDGQDPSAPWRAEAAARIEQHRKGNLTVSVVDANGEPVPNVTIHAEMMRHAYGFGTAVVENTLHASGADADMYREKLSNLAGDGRTFTTSVLENALKWPTWEGWNRRARVAQSVEMLKTWGMSVRGHNVVWPGYQFMPNDVEGLRNSPDALLARVNDHFESVLTYPGIQGEIFEWDVINEPTHVQDVENLLRGTPGYATGQEVYAEWFTLAQELEPNAVLYINEYNILTGGGNNADIGRYQDLIRTILDMGGPIQGIGVQGHFGSVPTPPERIYEILDEFATLFPEQRLSLTEYDAVGMPEDMAADYIRDVLTMFFSHPQTDNFLMWGFWDGHHWLGEAPIFSHDWRLKPSGAQFIDLVFNQWWTDEAVSAPSGTATVRGFKGDYLLYITAEGFEGITVGAAIDDEDGFTITLPAAGTQVPTAPRDFNGDHKDGTVNLSWLDQSGGETGFVIERAHLADGSHTLSDYIEIARVGANVTEFTDTLDDYGVYFYRVYAFNGIGNSIIARSTMVTWTNVTGGVSYQSGGAPWAVSASGLVRIEAEDYNIGFDGIAYQDQDPDNTGGVYRTDGVDLEATDDEGGGFQVTDIRADEWLQYTIDVPEAGPYLLRFRTTRRLRNDGTLQASAGATTDALAAVTAPIGIASSRGRWITTEVEANLEAGVQVLRLDFGEGGYALNWLEIGPPGSSVATEDADLPGQITLAGNYPNPFNPTTTIRYALPATSQVSLRVFDVLGRQVALVHDGVQAAGWHSAVFASAADLASGLYLYRLDVTALDGSTTLASRTGTMTLAK
ncbi:MAG: endo-1,4-beta-xylanase [Bacteroidota bacterium]